MTLTYVLDKHLRPASGSRLEGACRRLLAGDAEGLRAVVMEVVGGAAEWRTVSEVMVEGTGD